MFEYLRFDRLSHFLAFFSALVFVTGLSYEYTFLTILGIPPEKVISIGDIFQISAFGASPIVIVCLCVSVVMIFAAEFASRLSRNNAVLSGIIGVAVFCAPIVVYEIFGLFRPLATTSTLLAALLLFSLPFSRKLGHVDKWRSQRRIDVMSMKPRKLSAVLS